MKPTALKVNRTAIEKFWGLLLPNLADILPKVSGRFILKTQELEGLTIDLACENFPHQRVLRGRGGYIPVVPLLMRNGEDTDYWLSLHQNWREEQRRATTSLLYGTTSLTVYYGLDTEEDKLQLFRAEWPGVRSLPNGEFTFEASGADHPHWQIDVYQNYKNEVASAQKRLQDLIEIFRGAPQVEDFGKVVEEEIMADLARGREMCLQRLSRIHFAQRALWPVNPWRGDENTASSHAMAPVDVKEVANWCSSTILYVARELSR